MLKRSTLSKPFIMGFLVALAVLGFIPVKASESFDSFRQKTTQVENGSFFEVTKLLAEDGAAGDRFAQGMIISGNTLTIGAPYDDDYGTQSGSVYIFERDSGNPNHWNFVKKIAGADTSAGDEFGAWMDLEGDTLIVGAYLDNATAENSGSAYVFERNAGGPNNWGQVKKLISSDNSYRDRFGWQVALNGDTVVIGAYQNDDACSSDWTCNSGAAYIFERNMGGENNWGEVKKITASDKTRDDFFSWGLDFEEDTVVVGAMGKDDAGSESGAVYVFMRDWGGVDNWGEVTKLSASDSLIGDQFGNSITYSGYTLLVGARHSNTAGPDSGAAYVFERDPIDPANWVEVKKLVGNDTAAGDLFGDRQPAIGGDWIVIGATLNDNAGTDAGAVYVFERNLGGTNNWGQLAQLTASDALPGDEFGFKVEIQGQEIFAGARFHDGPAGTDQGTGYIFSFGTPALVANDDSGPDFTTDEATPFTTGNVLLNDISTDPISILGFDTTSTTGLVSNNGDGTFQYDPSGQFEYLSEGQPSFDAFEYTIGDTNNLTDTATVTITVLGLNDAPIIEPDYLTLTPNPVNEGLSVLLNGSFMDPDMGDAHAITITWGDGSTDMLNLPAGILTFEIPHVYLDDNPTQTPSDIYTIDVAVEDGFVSDSASVKLTVNNEAPLLSDLTVSMDKNGLATLTGSIIDPSMQDTFILKVKWGDRTTTIFTFPAGTTLFSVTHQYLGSTDLFVKSYIITLNLRDDDLGHASAKIKLTPPSSPISGAITE